MKKYFVFFIVCWVIFLIHAITIKHAIYGDGGGYYAYSQALFFDKGLNFEPINNYFQHFQGVKGEFSRQIYNKAPFPYLIGTGIIWLPSLAIASLFFHDRFSPVFEIGPGLTGILLVLAGFYFLEKYLRNHFSERVASIAVICLFLTSNLFYYSSFEPALSHQPAFFIVSFLLYKTYKMKNSVLNYSLVGALSGLLFITRMPDTLLLIPIFCQLWQLKPKVKYIVSYLISAVLCTIPLWWSLNIMLGNPFQIPYFMPDGMKMWSFSLNNIFTFLFTAKRGLFTWTPIYLFAIIGLIKSKKTDFIFTILLIILVSAWWAPASVSFGQRFVLAAIPYLAYGFAKLIENANIKRVAILFTTLLIWNWLVIFQFYFDNTNLIKNDNLTLKTFIGGQFKNPIKALKMIKDKGLHYLIYNNVLY